MSSKQDGLLALTSAIPPYNKMQFCENVSIVKRTGFQKLHWWLKVSQVTEHAVHWVIMQHPEYHNQKGSNGGGILSEKSCRVDIMYISVCKKKWMRKSLLYYLTGSKNVLKGIYTLEVLSKALSHHFLYSVAGNSFAISIKLYYYSKILSHYNKIFTDYKSIFVLLLWQWLFCLLQHIIFLNDM